MKVSIFRTWDGETVIFLCLVIWSDFGKCNKSTPLLRRMLRVGLAERLSEETYIYILFFQWKVICLFLDIKNVMEDLTKLSVVYFLSTFPIIESSWIEINIAIVCCFFFFLLTKVIKEKLVDSVITTWNVSSRSKVKFRVSQLRSLSHKYPCKMHNSTNQRRGKFWI